MIGLLFSVSLPYLAAVDEDQPKLTSRTPFAFSANAGFHPAEVLYAAETPSLDVAVLRDGLAFFHREGTKGHQVTMRIANPSGQPRLTPSQPTDTTWHHLVGPRENWLPHQRQFQRIDLQEIRPGVGLRVYTDPAGIRHDILLGPGTRDRVVELTFEGARNLRVAPDGAVTYDTILGPQRQTSRFAYTAGQRRNVPVTVSVPRPNVLRYEVSGVSPRDIVVIDPVYELRGTYFALPGINRTDAIAVSANQDVFIAGRTDRAPFPVRPGPVDNVRVVSLMYIARLDPELKSLRSFAFFGGGTGTESVADLLVTSSGAIFVAGSTASDQAFANGIQRSIAGRSDHYIARLRSDLSEVTHATYFGGPAHESTRVSLALDPNGRLAVFGSTDSNSSRFRMTAASPAYSADREGYIALIRPDLRGLIDVRYVSGSGRDEATSIVAASDGSFLLGLNTTSADLIPGSLRGYDRTYNGPDPNGAVMKLSPTLATTAATYAGNADSRTEGVILGGTGQIFSVGSAVSGNTTSSGFDTVNDTSPKGYIARFTDDLTRLFAATFLGRGGVRLTAGQIANGDRVLVLGEAQPGAEFPLRTNGKPPRGGVDIVLGQLTPDLRLVRNAGHFGGSGDDFHSGRMLQRGPVNNLLYVSNTTSQNWTVPFPAYQSTGPGYGSFVQEIAFTRDPVAIRANSTRLTPGTSTWAYVEMAAWHDLESVVMLASSSPAQMTPNVSSVIVPVGSLTSRSFRIVVPANAPPGIANLVAVNSGTSIMLPIEVLPAGGTP